jgi:hypothetical protein
MFILSFSMSSVFADSPITSTYFADVYKDEPIITVADSAKGILNDTLMMYLYDPENTVDVKMAVISALGWWTKNQNNASMFFDYLLGKGEFKNKEDFLQNGRGDLLLCMAYLLAMEDYFDVKPAMEYVDIAKQKNPESYTYNIIHALIHAQYMMDYDWCAVFKISQKVKQNDLLIIDMREKAIDRIYEYLDIYEATCE